MILYLIQRIFGAIPTLFLLAVLTFFLLRFAPGGPFDSERAFPPEVMANIEHKYGLDQPLVFQFTGYLRDLSRGDLRESFQYLGRPVSEIIGESLPYSLLVGGIALVLAVLIGVPLGAVAAWKANSWIDFSAMFLAISGISLPGYLVASLLVLIFSLQLGWFPPALWEGSASLVLPVLTLACRPMAIIARLTRASVLEALRSDYIRSARAKGLRDTVVVFRHALRNSLIPVVTVLGPIASHLVTGSFLVEVVFQLPGLGKHFVQAVLNRDYPLVMGVTLVYGVILISCNLLVDLLYGWIDPRVRVNG
jgi:oligopeptide transport system permease protein